MKEDIEDLIKLYQKRFEGLSMKMYKEGKSRELEIQIAMTCEFINALYCILFAGGKND